MTSPKDTFYSYLVAFAYWCGIAFASVLLLMIFHATHARWMTILRRPVEAMAATMPIFLAAGHPDLDRDEGALQLGRPGGGRLHPRGAGPDRTTRRRWLNVNFFIVRSVVYILFATFVGWRLFGLSLRQDKEGGTDLLVAPAPAVGRACCRSSPSRSPSRRSTG